MTKRLPLAATTLLLVTPFVYGGPLFDDYLNYLRPGPGTPPGEAKAFATNRGASQTFTVASDVGEVYRIGVRPVYETWQAGESVTMTLYGGDRKKLGAYTIDQTTSGTQAVHDTKDRILYFVFRAPTDKQTRLRFELTAQGGDNRVAFLAFDKDAYPQGQASGVEGVADLSFVVHIKPVADRQVISASSSPNV